VLTFIDPLCRNYCPLEARVLSEAIGSLPAAERPAVVAVSVNRWGDGRANLRADQHKWHVVPEWRWAVGGPRALAVAWRNDDIGVQVTTKTVAGVTVHEVSHTEASYLIDSSGHERALFLWPFTARRFTDAIASLER
jgi:cytochrome oxidase Cu insertion factor (SCO1/SenC/PrrC family)